MAARNLRECLVLQLRTDPARDPLAIQIIEHHCEALGRGRYEYMARALRAPLPRILAAAEQTRRLGPKPGRTFGGAEPRSEVQAARWFIEAIERRQQTIRRVVETLVRVQRDFFDHGPGRLRPLVLREVADEIAMHESTVSRAISAKYIETPHGVFPLKHFFQPGVPALTGGLVATLAVKAYLRGLIAGEDGRQPLSDLALAEALRRRGFVLARRTVAKYRNELSIPPCHRRVVGRAVMRAIDLPISLN